MSQLIENKTDHVPPSRDIWIQLATHKVKMTLNLACLHHNLGIQVFHQCSLKKAVNVSAWPMGHFWWMRNGWHIKKKYSKIYVHTSPPLSLPAYRHVPLTFKFQCGILHICFARLAKNGPIPYLVRKMQYLVPLKIKQLYLACGITSFPPVKHFSLPYTLPRPVERSHCSRRWCHWHVLTGQGSALNSAHLTGKFWVLCFQNCHV